MSRVSSSSAFALTFAAYKLVICGSQELDAYLFFQSFLLEKSFLSGGFLSSSLLCSLFLFSDPLLFSQTGLFCFLGSDALLLGLLSGNALFFSLLSGNALLLGFFRGNALLLSLLSSNTFLLGFQGGDALLLSLFSGNTILLGLLSGNTILLGFLCGNTILLSFLSENAILLGLFGSESLELFDTLSLLCCLLLGSKRFTKWEARNWLLDLNSLCGIWEALTNIKCLHRG